MTLRIHSMYGIWVFDTLFLIMHSLMTSMLYVSKFHNFREYISAFFSLLSLSASTLTLFAEGSFERTKVPMEYIITEVLFGYILQLPHPPQVVVYYSSIFIELCKSNPAVYPQIVSNCLFFPLLFSPPSFLFLPPSIPLSLSLSLSLSSSSSSSSVPSYLSFPSLPPALPPSTLCPFLFPNSSLLLPRVLPYIFIKSSLHLILFLPPFL